jgi:hypothetical protein
MDEAGYPYDVNGAVIKWRLMDKRYVPIIGDDAIITILDGGGGRISIRIPATLTADLPADLYTDAPRLIDSGQTGTLLAGPINVLPNARANAESQPQGNKQVQMVVYAKARRSALHK